MTDGPLHFTMRELQRSFFAPPFWAAIAGASLLVGLIGPFGTYDALALPGRLAYWAAIVVSTYFIGGACVFLFVRTVSPHRMPRPAMFAIAGAISGIPVTLAVWLINLAVFGSGSADAIALLPLAAYTIVIAAIVSTLLAVFGHLFERAKGTASGPAPQAPRPRIVDRLPPGQRGRLTRMSMQDHYVDVRTDKGGGLVLMRFADAIAETEGVDGVQIHRSHWVAKGAVAKAVRRDGKLFLRLANGDELPVSRSFQAAVKDAGLLAR